MKKTVLCITLLLFSPLIAMNFDDLFSGLGDGPDPFGDIFAAPPGGDDPFAHSMGMFGDLASSREEEKKEVTLPNAKTTKEAFSTALPEGANKVPKMHKQAVEEFFGELTEKLNTLSVVPTNLVLGSRLREQLQPTIDTIITADKRAEQVRSQSVYYLALFSKEHNSLRQRITKAITESDKVIGLFFDLDEVDSLKGPSSRQKRKRKQAFDKMNGLVKRSIEPIAEGLQKVIDDAKSSQQIETKKKKYAERTQKAQSGKDGNAFGGWSGDANDYFGDSYSMGGFGTNGWDYGMGGNNWDSLFGGGDNFGEGFGGGFDSGFGGFGSSGNFGSYDGSGSYGGDTRSSDGGSSSGGVLWGGPESEADSSLADTDSPEKMNGNPFVRAHGDLAEDAPPTDRYDQLAQKMIERLQKHTQLFAAANKEEEKDKVLHKAVSERSFAADINHLTTLAQLSADPAIATEQEHNEAFAALAKKFNAVLHAAIPFLVAAAKYVAPPFSRLTEEHFLKESDATMEAKSAELHAQQHKHHRNLSYRALIGWLGTIRHTGQRKIQQAVVEELHTHTHKVITALNTLLESMPANQPASFEHTEQLDMLSRQLLQEPIVIGYSTIPNEVPAQDATQKTVFAKLINDKKQLESKIIPFLKSSSELFTIMRTTLQEAIMKVRKAVENKATILTDPNALSAVSREMETVLDTTHKDHPNLSALKKVMIPYRKEFFEQLEVQTVLHSKLLELWQHEEEVPESEYMPLASGHVPTEETTAQATQLPTVPPTHEQPAMTPQPGDTTNLGPFQTSDFTGGRPPTPVPVSTTPTGGAPTAAHAMAPQVFGDEYTEDGFGDEEEGFFDGAARMAKSSGIWGKVKNFGKQLIGGVASDMQHNIRGAVNRGVSRGLNQMY